ncbi:hypothetical protein OOU_Y34scaffold00466g1 [Pyricularia oryzae Y34]|nr:hypothetical protein OOU_Y34scaffold00466g1 [Pyricularia oryzae Y34]
MFDRGPTAKPPSNKVDHGSIGYGRERIALRAHCWSN